MGTSSRPILPRLGVGNVADPFAVIHTNSGCSFRHTPVWHRRGAREANHPRAWVAVLTPFLVALPQFPDIPDRLNGEELFR